MRMVNPKKDMQNVAIRVQKSKTGMHLDSQLLWAND